jgi:hypothetical protein
MGAKKTNIVIGILVLIIGNRGQSPIKVTEEQIKR